MPRNRRRKRVALVRRNRRSNRNRSIRGSGVAIPPMFKTDIVTTHKFRFYAASLVAANRAVTWQNICTVYGFSLNTTVIYSPFDSVKLKKVEIWGSPPAAAGSVTTVGLEWGFGIAGFGSDTATYTDSSPNIDKCPHLRATPVPNSSQSVWHDNTDTGVAFYIACPQGTTIDVTCDFHLIEDNSTVSLTGSGYTANVWYFCRLDGPAGYFYAIAPGGNVT